MPIQEEEMRAKLSLDTTSVTHGRREIQSFGEAADHAFRKVGNPARELHHTLRDMMKDIPGFGLAFKFALNPVVGIVAAIGSGFAFVRSQIEKSREELNKFFDASHARLSNYNPAEGNLAGSAAIEDINRRVLKPGAPGESLSVIRGEEERKKLANDEAKRYSLQRQKAALDKEHGEAVRNYDAAINASRAAAANAATGGVKLGADVAGLESLKKTVEDELEKSKRSGFTQTSGEGFFTDVGRTAKSYGTLALNQFNRLFGFGGLAQPLDVGALTGKTSDASAQDKKTSALEQKLRQITHAIDQAKKAQDDLKNSNKDASAEMERQAAIVEKLRAEFNKTSAELQKMGGPIPAVAAGAINTATGGYAYRPIQYRGIQYHPLRGAPGYVAPTAPLTPMNVQGMNSQQLLAELVRLAKNEGINLNVPP